MNAPDTILTVSDWPDHAEVKIFESGSGRLLASARLDPNKCAHLAKKLLTPVIGKPKSSGDEFGHWVGQHGYHAPR